ncbi:SDR family NAD(P)-dependent oxidoreductase [Gimesia maris]|uniref:SDR family NAD(P)-dependent oxidoreductase n=1 Tax=Gimesia maris TaxID=122 RepID=UPI0001542AA2|nr:SDR family NAD(P)-dependent oxidoreductase [Gimesia maris]EDL58078.1 short-chain dehydrogenase/reductase SDR [Gimesia maris DSM 8797]
MQTVLITGASAGFGKLVAEKLLAKGYTVYAAARRVEKMRDLNPWRAYHAYGCDGYRIGQRRCREGDRRTAAH